MQSGVRMYTSPPSRCRRRGPWTTEDTARSPRTARPAPCRLCSYGSASSLRITRPRRYRADSRRTWPRQRIWRVDAGTDRVHRIDEGLSILAVRGMVGGPLYSDPQSRLHEEGAEAVLVLLRTHERCERLGTNPQRFSRNLYEFTSYLTAARRTVRRSEDH